MAISPRQKRVYDFIKGYIKSNQEPPTIMEIGDHFGYSSSSTIHRILLILEHEGLIKRTPLVSRGLEIVGN